MKKHILLAFVAILAIGIQGCSVEEEDFSIPNEKTLSPLLISEQDNNQSKIEAITIYYGAHWSPEKINVLKKIVSKFFNINKQLDLGTIESAYGLTTRKEVWFVSDYDKFLFTNFDQKGMKTNKEKILVMSTHDEEEIIDPNSSSGTQTDYIFHMPLIEKFYFKTYLK